MNETLHELSPISEQDCLYVIERRKKEFTFPIHIHKEFELNYVENADKAQRVVGDSVEEIGELDLVLITGERLEHAWQNHLCQSDNIREITIQFSSELFSSSLLDKTQFGSIKKMFERARHGVAFPLSTILKVRSLLNALTCEAGGFYSVIAFFSLMYELSLSKEARVLSSSAFANGPAFTESSRIHKIDTFLQRNYQRKIKLEEAAELVNMTPVAFSRFFKLRSGKNFSDYLTDIRIGHTTRLLVDSNSSVAEICYECGFNNLSNFNRIFKAKKNCSPREFREIYKKRRMIF